MGSGGCPLVLLLLLIVSQNQNRMLASFHKKISWKCPQIRAQCLFKEVNSCISDKDCKSQSKCCLLSCGMKCLGYNEDPCEEVVIQNRHCPHTLTRWYFDIRENDCFPIEYGTCFHSKNNFQSYDVCKKTCLAFGHGESIKLFELEGVPFTVLV